MAEVAEPGGVREKGVYARAIRGRSIREWSLQVPLRQLTAIIEREESGYVSFCPELDIASQGDTIEEARENLREALELFFETASPEEVRTRLHEEVYVTRVEVGVG
jgi:predicted RNase H-like HicB family nuclease